MHFSPTVPTYSIHFSSNWNDFSYFISTVKNKSWIKNQTDNHSWRGYLDFQLLFVWKCSIQRFLKESSPSRYNLHNFEPLPMHFVSSDYMSTFGHSSSDTTNYFVQRPNKREPMTYVILLCSSNKMFAVAIVPTFRLCWIRNHPIVTLVSYQFSKRNTTTSLSTFRNVCLFYLHKHFAELSIGNSRKSFLEQ